MTNKERYQRAFSVLKSSQRMEMEDLKMKKSKLFGQVAAVAAAVVLGFGVSNGICYASTGATWVEKMVVYFNGEPVETPVTVTVVGDEAYSYEMEVPEDSAGSVVVVTDEDSEELTFSIATEDVETDTMPYLEETEGVLWFCFLGERVDITEDFADGLAEGMLTVQGLDYIYQLTGSREEYYVSLELVE